MNLPQTEFFPQPEANDPDTVPRALDALRTAHDEASANEATDAFLWSVGDNHLGTFFPVVLAVLPQLQAVLETGSAWGRRAVLESLIDLGGTFIPQAGHETHLGMSVQATLRAFIHGLRPLVAQFSQSADASVAASARELMDLIDDQV